MDELTPPELTVLQFVSRERFAAVAAQGSALVRKLLHLGYVAVAGSELEVTSLGTEVLAIAEAVDHAAPQPSAPRHV